LFYDRTFHGGLRMPEPGQEYAKMRLSLVANVLCAERGNLHRQLTRRVAERSLLDTHSQFAAWFDAPPERDSGQLPPSEEAVHFWWRAHRELASLGAQLRCSTERTWVLEVDTVKRDARWNAVDTAERLRDCLMRSKLTCLISFIGDSADDGAPAPLYAAVVVQGRVLATARSLNSDNLPVPRGVQHVRALLLALRLWQETPAVSDQRGVLLLTPCEHAASLVSGTSRVTQAHRAVLMARELAAARGCDATLAVVPKALRRALREPVIRLDSAPDRISCLLDALGTFSVRFPDSLSLQLGPAPADSSNIPDLGEVGIVGAPTRVALGHTSVINLLAWQTAVGWLSSQGVTSGNTLHPLDEKIADWSSGAWRHEAMGRATARTLLLAGVNCALIGALDSCGTCGCPRSQAHVLGDCAQYKDFYVARHDRALRRIAALLRDVNEHFRKHGMGAPFRPVLVNDARGRHPIPDDILAGLPPGSWRDCRPDVIIVDRVRQRVSLLELGVTSDRRLWQQDCGPYHTSSSAAASEWISAYDRKRSQYAQVCSAINAAGTWTCHAYPLLAGHLGLMPWLTFLNIRRLIPDSNRGGVDRVLKRGLRSVSDSLARDAVVLFNMCYAAMFRN